LHPVAEAVRQKDLLLILAREFASKLATPMIVLDEKGSLVFFNEPAEAVLGRRFAEAQEVQPSDWVEHFHMQDLEGNPLSLEDIPAGIALLDRRPAHRVFRITGLDGVQRAVSVTAFPLFSSVETFVGVVGIFWSGEETEG
jgi:PAS domain-containing protein